MTVAAESLKTQAGELSSRERADLAYFLVTTLDGPAEEDAEQEVNLEIERRVAEIRGGMAIGRPVEDVLVELREKYP